MIDTDKYDGSGSGDLCNVGYRLDIVDNNNKKEWLQRSENFFIILYYDNV